METERYLMIEKAGEIIMKSGIQELTIKNLATELVVSENILYNQLTKDDDILLLILKDFEIELKEYIHSVANKRETPDTELKLLFKGLYFLFLQKPYYLSIIFDKSLKDKDDRIRYAILKIVTIAENHLFKIINAGKTINSFQSGVPTRKLVAKILSDFRSFMKDEQLVNEMIMKLKTLKEQ